MSNFILGFIVAVVFLQIVNSIAVVLAEKSRKYDATEYVLLIINVTILMLAFDIGRWVTRERKAIRVKKMNKQNCCFCGSKNIRAWYGDRSVWSECRDCKHRAAKAYGSAKHRALVQEQVKSWNKK